MADSGVPPVSGTRERNTRPRHALWAGPRERGREREKRRLGSARPKRRGRRGKPAQAGLQAAAQVSFFFFFFLFSHLSLFPKPFKNGFLNSNQIKPKPHRKSNQMQQHECIIKHSTYYFIFLILIKYYLNYLNS
jgi:hypothetical protein